MKVFIHYKKYTFGPITFWSKYCFELPFDFAMKPFFLLLEAYSTSCLIFSSTTLIYHLLQNWILKFNYISHKSITPYIIIYLHSFIIFTDHGQLIVTTKQFQTNITITTTKKKKKNMLFYIFLFCLTITSNESKLP